MKPTLVDLCKNLILSGLNITIFDSEQVNQADLEENPLIRKNDLG